MNNTVEAALLQQMSILTESLSLIAAAQLRLASAAEKTADMYERDTLLNERMEARDFESHTAPPLEQGQPTAVEIQAAKQLLMLQKMEMDNHYHHHLHTEKYIVMGMACLDHHMISYQKHLQ